MQHKEKVLVTGANGLLGSNVADQLSKQGYDVVAVVRKNSNLLALKEIKCKIVECDITQRSEVEKAIAGCSYVVHCAANTQQSPGNLEAYQRINIDSTSILIQQSKLHEIKRFVFVSTANCFTNGTVQNPGDESKGFMPWLKNSGYAYSKYLAQQMVLEEVEKKNFPAIVVAPTFIIGPRDAKVSSGKLIMHALKRKVVFYPPGGKSIVDVEFAAEAIANSLRIGNIGECYLLSGENLTYKQIFGIIKKHKNDKAMFIKIPRWILILIAQIASIFEYVFSISLSLNRTNQRLLCLDNYFSNRKAMEHLYLKQTNSDFAIEKAILWYNKNGYW